MIPLLGHCSEHLNFRYLYPMPEGGVKASSPTTPRAGAGPAFGRLGSVVRAPEGTDAPGRQPAASKARVRSATTSWADSRPALKRM
jgi:hypothetical protein